MLPTTDTDYKKIFSELIKKQMLVLGPDITLAKVKNVQGITVDNNGEVQSITGDPQQLLQLLINQFVELSGMIVKKTMESILTTYPGVLISGTATQSAIGIPAPSSTAFSQAEHIENMPVVPIVSPQPIHADQMPIQQNTPQPENMSSSVAQQSLDAAPQQSSGAEEPPQFSQNQMEELNHALDALSKAPLSTEASSK